MKDHEMTDTLTFLQLLCLALLLTCALAYEFFKLKWRAEAAEQLANSERLRRATVEHELEHVHQLLSDLQRVATQGDAPLVADSTSSRILPKETPVTIVSSVKAQIHPDQPV
jgi:hypothetical protein